MSTTIGIGIGKNTGDDTELFETLEKLVGRYGYGLLNGVAYAELDMRAGLEIAQKHRGWEHVLLLQYPPVDGLALAFGIDQELTALEMKGNRPTFFDFLGELARECTERFESIDVFFSGEWHSGDRVRFSYGTLVDLITLLSMPAHWGIRYLIPETGHFQDSDETPLIFEVRL